MKIAEAAIIMKSAEAAIVLKMGSEEMRIGAKWRRRA